jgi:hypothetical protein
MSEKYYQQNVAAVEVLGGWRLRVTFEDGYAATIDLAPLLECGPIFQPLRDASFFAQVKVSEWGVLEWPGEIDISSGSLRAWCEAGKFMDYEETNAWIEQHSSPAQKVA